MSTTQFATGRSVIGFHKGHALLHLADTYPTLFQTIHEMVQNACDDDVRASRIWIRVDYQHREIVVRDNGLGATTKKFDEALATVATPGRKGKGTLGQFGIGLISPLGKCERFTFISCPSPHTQNYHEWTFVSDLIVNEKDNLSIPNRSRPDLSFGDRDDNNTKSLEWRSEMRLIKFTKDSVISKILIDDLVGSLQDRYSPTMRRNKTVISVEIIDKFGRSEIRPNVTALDFRGEKLEEQTFNNEEGGSTLFRLYIANKTAEGRKGRVHMGILGRDFRFPFHYFARSASEFLSEEVLSSLNSGLFEGEIISEKAVLHAEREAFVKTESFAGLCAAIQEWFNQFGAAHVESLRQNRQEQRFQELGQRSIQVLQHLLSDPAHKSLLDVINSFRGGAHGDDFEGGPQKDADDTDPKAVLGEGKSPVLREPKPPGPPRDKPTTPTEPRNKPLRKLVKSSGFGLQFAHEAMQGSPELWRLDTHEGVLAFNIRHPLWIACDGKDATLMKLQECVAMQALTLHTMPEPYRPHQRMVLDEFNHSLVSWILSSDKVRSAAPVKRP